MMPSNVVERGGRFAARVVIDGEERWLGTHDTKEGAEAAVDAEKARALRAAAQRRAVRHDPEGSRCPSREELDAILEAIWHPAFRDFCVFAAWSGLRLREASLVEARDVALTGGATARVSVRHGKRLPGGPPRRRTSLLYEPGIEVVAPLLLSRPARGLLFVNAAGNVWTRQTVADKFERACLKAGVEGVTFHSLRKFHGTWLLDQGVSELDTAVQLGHFRRDGRPHVDLIRKVYGWPSTEAALERLEQVG